MQARIRHRTRHIALTGMLAVVLGCSAGSSDEPLGGGPPPSGPSIPTSGTLAALARAESCDDLLTRIQDDAIAKAKMAAEVARRDGPPDEIVVNDGVAAEDDATPARAPAGDATASNAGLPTPPAASAPTSGSTGARGEGATADESASAAPTSSSDTNRQVKEVDEADFVKVVQNGAGMFLLHGDTLQRLVTFPPEQTALRGAALKIEGTPSEMFVTDKGRAVVFSTVYGATPAKPLPAASPEGDIAPPCMPGGRCFGGASMLKVTLVDVAGEAPRVERELYYEGSYVSSRRYASETSDVVRVIVQSTSPYAGLYTPAVDWYDAWGRRFADEVIHAQLAEWERRTTAAIRATTLDDWLPSAKERKDGQLLEVARACDAHYVPVAGVSDHGLTQVLSLDALEPQAQVGGVTIVGATSTVYANARRLVLAQPDYRWGRSSRDLGILGEQRTALHLFELEGAGTSYIASGFVSGHLPPHNPQFGIDVAADGTVRVATTGLVRDDPAAKPGDTRFGRQHPETRVITARASGTRLDEVGRSRDLGLPGERVQSARFVGDRAYVVTFLQTDPLVVVDVSNAAAPTVLGEIKIPGFSQYMHPLDDNHLITVGQSATRGIQLQLFDVTNPMAIPPPKVHDFGSGSRSEASYSHKAFTLYQGILAVPVSGAFTSQDLRYRYYTSALQLLRVDASTGFSYLGAIDHAPLYADNGAGVRCGSCDVNGCFAYACGYAPEVRRGHFVSAESRTYVYSFSHAGVLVHELANLAQPLARVGLPAPQSGGVRPPFLGGAVPDAPIR